MAYDEFLADRIKTILDRKHKEFEEKKMMGGLCYLVNEKMCLGIVRNSLMARIDPDFQNEALMRQGCREMDFTHKPMKGYVFIDPEGTDSDSDLEFWIDKSLEFNPKAKSSKKKR